MKLDIDLKNLSKTEREKLLALVEKASKKSTPHFIPNFIPKKGEKYYYIELSGAILDTENNEYFADSFRISIGDCFRTIEEAKEAKIRLRMQTKWKRLSLEAGEDKNPWDGEHQHYFACWDCIEKRIGYLFHNECKDGLICFPTEKSIKTAVAELGEETVKKYILGVTELHQLLTEVEVEDDEDDV